MKRIVLGGLPGLFLLFCGCSSDADVTAELEAQGFTDIELERQGSADFTFEAKQGLSDCSGTVRVQKGLGKTKSSVDSSCSSHSSEVVRDEDDAGAAGADKGEAGDAKIFALEAMGPDFRYTPSGERSPSKVSVKDASNVGHAAQAFLEAATVGDRHFLSVNGTALLRKDLHEMGVTQGIQILRTLGDMSLTLYNTKVHPGGIEVGMFHIEHTEGSTEDPIDFVLTLEEGKFHGFDLTGQSLADARKAIEGEQEAKLELLSTDPFTQAGGLVPKIELAEGEDVVIRFVFVGLAQQEGKIKVSFNAKSQHPEDNPGGKLDEVDVEPTLVESPGSVNADVTLYAPVPGTHHIDIDLKDEFSGATMKASYDAVVSRAK